MERDLLAFTHQSGKKDSSKFVVLKLDTVRYGLLLEALKHYAGILYVTDKEKAKPYLQLLQELIEKVKNK